MLLENIDQVQFLLASEVNHTETKLNYALLRHRVTFLAILLVGNISPCMEKGPEHICLKLSKIHEGNVQTTEVSCVSGRKISHPFRIVRRRFCRAGTSSQKDLILKHPQLLIAGGHKHVVRVVGMQY